MQLDPGIKLILKNGETSKYFKIGDFRNPNYLVIFFFKRHLLKSEVAWGLGAKGKNKTKQNHNPDRQNEISQRSTREILKLK